MSDYQRHGQRWVGAAGVAPASQLFETNLFHSRMIRPAGRGPDLPETTPVVGWRETGSKSSMSRLFINIDAQDAQDYLARGFTVLSSTIVCASTRIPKSPLPSSCNTSNAHPVIEPFSFSCTSFSSCLSCLSMFPKTANRIIGTWSLFPNGHEGPLFHSRMIRTAGRGPAGGQTEVSQRV